MKSGIASIGKINTDSSIEGIIINIAKNIACCWVWETVEIKSPNAIIAATKTIDNNRRGQIEFDGIGKLKIKFPRYRMKKNSISFHNKTSVNNTNITTT